LNDFLWAQKKDILRRNFQKFLGLVPKKIKNFSLYVVKS